MHFFGTYRHRQLHAQCPRDTMADMHHRMFGGDFAAARFVQCEFAFKKVDITNEICHEPAIRRFIHVSRIAHLQNLPLAHDGNAIRHRHRFVLIMRHHHASDANGFDDVDQFKLRLLAQFSVQCAQGLVQQQQLWLSRQAARECDALLLPA